MKRTTKATATADAGKYGSASKKQRWALFLYTRKDYRKVVLSAEDASKMLSDLSHEANLARIRKGVAVEVKFEADAKRLFEALKGKGVKCALKGGAWVFTPPATASDPDGFPTR